MNAAAGSGPPLRSALPSRRARVLAFVSICLAGLCGGITGYAYEDIQCDGDCGISIGLYTLGGALLASTGVAIISVLALRAMEEWQRGSKKRS